MSFGISSRRTVYLRRNRLLNNSNGNPSMSKWDDQTNCTIQRSLHSKKVTRVVEAWVEGRVTHTHTEFTARVKPNVTNLFLNLVDFVPKVNQSAVSCEPCLRRALRQESFRRRPQMWRGWDAEGAVRTRRYPTIWDENALSDRWLQNQSEHVSRCWITIAGWLALHAWKLKERERKGENSGEETSGSFHFFCTIQVTGARAENGSPHRAPPEGAAVRGVQVYVEVCVCVHEGCNSLSYIIFSRVGTHWLLCVRFAVYVCTHHDSNTPWQNDHTLLPTAPRSLSAPLLSLHRPQRSYVLPHMSKPVSCG